jgi:hypothetical protein
MTAAAYRGAGDGWGIIAREKRGSASIGKRELKHLIPGQRACAYDLDARYRGKNAID